MIKSSIHKSKKKPYTFFLFKLVVLCAIVFLLDFFAGNVLRYFYFKQDSGLQYRTTYSIDKTTADVLTFGSSRANHHYQPDIFEKRLQLSFYNVGRDGNYIFYHYAVLKGVLERYAPKMVILDFVRGEFKKNQDDYDRLSALLPYYKGHPGMRPIIELKSPYEKLKLFSCIYPFNSSMFTIGVGNTEFNKKRMGDIKGYVPLKGIWNKPIEFDVNSSVKYELDSIKVKVYEAFIKDCINAKVKLYIICSPYYLKSNHAEYSVTLGQEIAKKYNVRFFDYSRDSMFINNSKVFADVGHLNDEGAKVFSNMLIDNLDKAIEIKDIKYTTTLPVTLFNQ